MAFGWCNFELDDWASMTFADWASFQICINITIAPEIVASTIYALGGPSTIVDRTTTYVFNTNQIYKTGI